MSHDLGGLSDIPAENREAALQLGHALKCLHKHISSKVMRGMQAELIELDLSFSQMTALHVLRARGSVTVTQLSERTRLSLPAASHLVERLVQRGLAQREENPENRREKVVQLTQAGLGALSGMDSGFVRAYVETFATLPPELIRATTQNMELLLSALDLADAPCLPEPSLKNPEETP
ncbi:MarR family winged helix-turn-helix transcriptional regulator [Deinococcus fonticola]|uniref:MarR family winged helix-turn-helix transcriptional regulator n=1 Tax=Deinococcus fonticola TaxID=2528713 RepID=UPI001074A41C|nr:MarR family transcriptional regulator [Deinococcus fonticola]